MCKHHFELYINFEKQILQLQGPSFLDAWSDGNSMDGSCSESWGKRKEKNKRKERREINLKDPPPQVSTQQYLHLHPQDRRDVPAERPAVHCKCANIILNYILTLKSRYCSSKGPASLMPGVMETAWMALADPKTVVTFLRRDQRSTVNVQTSFLNYILTLKSRYCSSKGPASLMPGVMETAWMALAVKLRAKKKRKETKEKKGREINLKDPPPQVSTQQYLHLHPQDRRDVPAERPAVHCKCANIILNYILTLKSRYCSSKGPASLMPGVMETAWMALAVKLRAKKKRKETKEKKGREINLKDPKTVVTFLRRDQRSTVNVQTSFLNYILTLKSRYCSSKGPASLMPGVMETAWMALAVKLRAKKKRKETKEKKGREINLKDPPPQVSTQQYLHLHPQDRRDVPAERPAVHCKCANIILNYILTLKSRYCSSKGPASLMPGVMETAWMALAVKLRAKKKRKETKEKKGREINLKDPPPQVSTQQYLHLHPQDRRDVPAERPAVHCKCANIILELYINFEKQILQLQGPSFLDAWSDGNSMEGSFVRIAFGREDARRCSMTSWFMRCTRVPFAVSSLLPRCCCCCLFLFLSTFVSAASISIVVDYWRHFMKFQCLSKRPLTNAGTFLLSSHLQASIFVLGGCSRLVKEQARYTATVAKKAHSTVSRRMYSFHVAARPLLRPPTTASHSISVLWCSYRGITLQRTPARHQAGAGMSGGHSDGDPSSFLKAMDVETKARGFDGTYAMAEKLARAQEDLAQRLPHLKAYAGDGGDCCGGDHTYLQHINDSEGAAADGSAGVPVPATGLMSSGIPAPATPHHGASIERLLVESTIESIRSSAAHLSTPKGAAHRGIQRLLDYNKQWAVEVSRCNPTYFADLATEQKPEYLWIGCSDSRVPANEIVGLHPGDVFVHRNIGNIFSLSDLNCLSALQFAVDCLKVEHVIVAGHYKCGGVTAAMQGQKLGLTEHWIMQVTDIKNRWWHRVVGEIPEASHLNVLCELNVLEQLSHVVSCCIIQRRWNELNAMDDGPDMEDKAHIRVSKEYTQNHRIYSHTASTARVFSKAAKPVDVEVHGWVYSLDDGMLRPLLRLTRHCNIEKEVNKAREAIFIRYSSG
eukprot:gene10885-7546_t